MGMVYEILRTSFNDGPGLRTTVFLKGCPLRCVWCHNPESYIKTPSLFFFSEKCGFCGACADACAYRVHGLTEDSHKINPGCVLCGACPPVCLNKALEIKGSEMSAVEILEIAARDKKYYNATGGGITLSGGEPLMQADFTEEVLQLCRSNAINTCLETSGFADQAVIRRIAPLCDTVLFDIKGLDDKKHLQYTGVSNQKILENLTLFDQLGTALILRCPLVPGLNDSEDDIKQICDLSNGLVNVLKVEIMPYHNFGVHKLDRFLNSFEQVSLPNATDDDKAAWRSVLESCLNKPFIIN